MKTTTIYLALFYLAFLFNANAQVNNYAIDPCSPPKFPSRTHFIKPSGELQPVYFNYSRRQLFYNNAIRLNGNDFLSMCRNINDAQVRRQIARYDQLSKNKRLLVGLAIGTGVTGYIVSVASSFYYNSGQQSAMVATGVLSLLACPILAISTSIPHQKRKEVIFRDLPYAYNAYVLNQNNK